MKEFRLNIDLEKDAFESIATYEIARILKHIADKLERDPELDINYYQTIIDINGNDVGRYAIKSKE